MRVRGQPEGCTLRVLPRTRLARRPHAPHPRSSADPGLVVLLANTNTFPGCKPSPGFVLGPTVMATDSGRTLRPRLARFSLRRRARTYEEDHLGPVTKQWPASSWRAKSESGAVRGHSPLLRSNGNAAGGVWRRFAAARWPQDFCDRPLAPREPCPRSRPYSRYGRGIDSPAAPTSPRHIVRPGSSEKLQDAHGLSLRPRPVGFSHANPTVNATRKATACTASG